MKKYLFLLLSIFVSYTLSAQCLGEDCSIKGRNKAAKKKAIKLTGSKSAGKSYSNGQGYKSRKRSGHAFDPFGSGSSKKSSAGGFDPFEAESNRKKHKGGGGFDPFASNKKSKRSNSGGFDPFASSGNKKYKGGGGYDPFSKGGKKMRMATSDYDGWDTGGSKRHGSRGKANDSWARNKKISSSSGGGIWASSGAGRSSSGRRSGGGNNSWSNAPSNEAVAPPVYEREDNTPKSWSDFESNSFSKDVTFDKPYYYKFSLIAGSILKHTDKVNKQIDGVDVRPVLGAELAIEYPTQGNKNWHHYFNLPTYGFALTYLNLGNEQRLGQAFAFYPYVDIPLIRSKAIDFNFSNGFGVSYITKYDKTDSGEAIDPSTDGSYLIGSPVNVFIKTGFGVNIRPVTLIGSDEQERQSHYTLSAGVSLIHMSNGNFSSPNTGLNILAGSLSLKYTPTPVNQVLRQKPDEIPHYFTFDVMGMGGVREMYQSDKKYAVGNFNTTVYYQMANIYRLGLGLDGFYDQAFKDVKVGGVDDAFKSEYPKLASYQNSSYDRTKFTSLIRGGICLSNEFVLGRVAVALDGGFYVYDNIKAADESIYYRLALKYRFTNRLFGVVAVKTHKTDAEFLTLGAGYSLPLY
jgi:hypothetical protein